MKLTIVTAVFNAIKSGNRENLIRCGENGKIEKLMGNGTTYDLIDEIQERKLLKGDDLTFYDVRMRPLFFGGR